MKSIMKIAGAAYALVFLTGCRWGHPPPATNCADPEAKATVVSMLYENARKSVDAFVADGTFKQGDALKSQIEALHETGVLTISLTALEGHDEKIDRTTCSAVIAYKLPAEDRSAKAADAWKRIRGLEVPNDLLGEAPSTPIQYTVQPSPDGDGRNIQIMDAHIPSSAVLGLSLSRLMRTHPDQSTF